MGISGQTLFSDPGSKFKQEEFCSEKVLGLRLRITNEGVLTNSRIL